MSVIRLPIDIKSLYFNIKNDNETGHTATVATPLKQGSSIHEELAQIRNIPENINSYSRDSLISQILSKSRAAAIITDVFVFESISVNGTSVECESRFCIYIREETDQQNFHFGRQKVHYPPTLKFSDSDIDINNRKVIDAISESLCNYAFIVEAFEYDTESKNLNFDVTTVGENGIPYSKIFLNKRGVGNKFSSVFNEFADTYDSEIIALREHLGYENVSPENYMEIINRNKSVAVNRICSELNNSGFGGIRKLAEEYPYSLYDVEYSDRGKKKFVIIRFTSTKTNYFSLPYNKIKFCNDFADSVKIALVTDVNGIPNVHWYAIEDLNKMNKTINSITYTNGGEHS